MKLQGSRNGFACSSGIIRWLSSSLIYSLPCMESTSVVNLCHSVKTSWSYVHMKIKLLCFSCQCTHVPHLWVAQHMFDFVVNVFFLLIQVKIIISTFTLILWFSVCSLCYFEEVSWAICWRAGIKKERFDEKFEWGTVNVSVLCFYGVVEGKDITWGMNLSTVLNAQL